MSKAIVNMTPNPSDIQTIHCSQGDTEGREWEFELHNNGEVIDAGGITDQIIFKAYEGGTEELLPSSLMNGSVDLGSLTWTYMPNNYFRSSAVISDAKIPSNENTVANIFCSILKPNTANYVYANNEGIAIDGTGRIRIYYDDMPTDVASFTQAMQGVYLWYETTDSTPTTTPFLGDIKYPQGLLTNQQFTYRESPTEEDGLAYIVGIKGQTLKWNQLASVVGEQTNTVGLFDTNTYVYSGHKYLMTVEATPTSSNTMYLSVYYNNGSNRQYGQVTGTTSGKYTLIFNCNYTASGGTANVLDHFWFYAYNASSWKNLMLFDLTAMGIDSLTNAEILQWFADYYPLSYYPFNNGSLIPFMGNGIKTEGFNQWDEEWEAGALSVTDGSTINVNSYLRSKNFIPVISGKTYCRGISYQSDCRVFYYDANHSYIGNVATSSSNTLFTIPSGVSFIKFHKNGANYDNNICINISDTSKNGTYEPYTSSTLSLPISTYFSNGMKSAGNVYDELTPTKAITRIGAVDLGSLGWYYNTSSSRFITTEQLTDAKRVSNNNEVPNMVCPLFEAVSLNVSADTSRNKTIAIGSSDGNLRVRDSSFTDATAFTQAMSGVYLYYEMVTPTETSFTTASLVTENAEIPLSNEDGVLIGKCTEQLSADAGFIEGKIKLSDSDGDVYSNKIQIHVERMPE